MLNRILNRNQRSALIALAILPTSGVQAAMVLGTDWGDGSFTELSYGASGLAYVTPWLYVGDFAATDSPSNQAAVSLLDFAQPPAVSGLGTPAMEVTYSFTNNDSLAFHDLRFMLNVEASDTAAPNYDIDEGLAIWGTKSADDPDQYEIAVYDLFAPGGIPDSILGGTLHGTNTCVAPCDVDTALQWNLASLEPGQTWQVLVHLSDDGSAVSSRYLQAASNLDPVSTTLTFSGTAAVVPLPSTLVLLGSALAGILGFVRRRA
jgi:hypothetical protein